MPPWRSPEAGTSIDLKFIRIRRDIFVGHSRRDGHMDIAEMDGLLVTLDVLRMFEPTEIDAGHVMADPESSLSITGDSSSLDLPVYDFRREAREITIADFRKQSPDFRVVSQKL